MNKELKDFIDGIVIPSDVMTKRIKTGEKVRELCENIERAVKEVYGESSLHCYAELDGRTVDAEQIYYFNCKRPTPSAGGYFACVYLYMEDDFMDADKYDTTFEIMFSETEPKLNEHYDYDIWDGPETTINITVGPDDWRVSYTHLNDPEHYPVMTGDVDRINKFIDIIEKGDKSVYKTLTYIHNVCPKPEEYDFTRYRKWLEETTVRLITDINDTLKDIFGDNIKIINNDPDIVDEEVNLLNFEFDIAERKFSIFLGTDLKVQIHDEYDIEPIVQVCIGVEERVYDKFWDRYEYQCISLSSYFIGTEIGAKLISMSPWEKSTDCEMSDEEINTLFGTVFESLLDLVEKINKDVTVS